MFADSMLAELDQEAATTRRVLERVPNQHLEPKLPASADEIWYHHRGPLAVSSRCLGVPVPAIGGRSADEKLFGA